MNTLIYNRQSSERPKAASPRLLNIYRLETFYELLKVLRMPAFAIPTLAFPAVFFLMFGVMFNGDQPGVLTAILIGYAAFGALGAALFGFGINSAIERGQGWMLLKRSSPMPFSAYLFAKTFVAVVFAALVVALLVAMAYLFAAPTLTASQLLSMTGTLLIGILPFCVFGLALGYLGGPNSAPALVNLIYLPLAFASGMWIPIQALPDFIQRIAHFLPTYHYVQLAYKTAELDQGGATLLHIAVLIGFGLFSAGLASFLYRRDEGLTYG